MSWHVKLGGQLSVHSDGVDVGPATNHTVAALLIGLLSRGSDWSGREELAQLLYPDSEPAVRRSSLRQSLFRMRRWVGPSALEEDHDRLRLSDGMWSYDLLLTSGEDAPGPMIAPGVTHPWVEALRLKWSPVVAGSPSDAAACFAAAVAAAAKLDVDSARSLLVGGGKLADALSLDRFGELVALTQPKDRRDPMAFEHLLLRARLFERCALPHEAKAAGMQAYRLASQQRHMGNVIVAGAMLLFFEIEDGQMGEAAAWVDYLQKERNADTKSLLFCNAKAAYLWNMHRLDEAVAQMGQAIRRIPSADRATRLHFWTNYSVLCAEAANIELGEEALAQARALANPNIDVPQILTLDLAQATRLISLNRPDEAVTMLQEELEQVNERHFELADWYANEALAEALAAGGRGREAIRAWRAVEARRLSRCTRLTPRLLARRARIFRSV